MLRHTGTNRTYNHDLKLAALLCLTAGLVNISGFIGFMVFTTNVTGHVAQFAERLAYGNFNEALLIGIWMLMFLAGAIFSSLYLGYKGKQTNTAYVFPVIVEIVILVAVGAYGQKMHGVPGTTKYFVGGLLFAMGLQNALVSVISGAVVRTTHLTGMFTDLGIEMSALVYAEEAAKQALRRKILLRGVIIFFFITGGIIGSFLFAKLHYYTFFVPASILVIVLAYDVLGLGDKVDVPPVSR